MLTRLKKNWEIEKLLECSEVEKLMGMYHDIGGKVYTLEEGTLGYGTMVMVADGYKATVIHEVYVNEWTCGHKFRKYNKLPEKYRKAIENKTEDAIVKPIWA